jgi:hypothetical protein
VPVNTPASHYHLAVRVLEVSGLVTNIIESAGNSSACKGRFEDFIEHTTNESLRHLRAVGKVQYVSPGGIV